MFNCLMDMTCLPPAAAENQIWGTQNPPHLSPRLNSQSQTWYPNRDHQGDHQGAPSRTSKDQTFLRYKTSRKPW